MGKTAAVVHEIKPAKAIIDEMVSEAVEYLQIASKFINPQSKL